MSKLTNEQRKILDNLYYNVKTGFVGIDQLKRRSELPRKTVKNYLLEQETYTKHRPAVQKFPTRKVIVYSIDHQHQADLVDMRSLSKHNDDFNYIMTVIDVLSKFAYAVPIKRKTGDHITEAFKTIYRHRKPKLLQTDHGSEFINSKTQALLKSLNIEWFETYNETKAQIVERFNRTLKDRMYRYFTAKSTKRWIDILPDLVNNYNSSYHSSIKMTPIEALDNPRKALENLHSQRDTKGKPKFTPGNFVRISKYRGKFKRGYTANYTDEVFVVTDVLKTTPTTYQIADIRKADKIIGTFYEEELSLFKPTKVKQII